MGLGAADAYVRHSPRPKANQACVLLSCVTDIKTRGILLIYFAALGGFRGAPFTGPFPSCESVGADSVEPYSFRLDLISVY